MSSGALIKAMLVLFIMGDAVVVAVQSVVGQLHTQILAKVFGTIIAPGTSSHRIPVPPAHSLAQLAMQFAKLNIGSGSGGSPN